VSVASDAFKIALITFGTLMLRGHYDKAKENGRIKNEEGERRRENSLDGSRDEARSLSDYSVALLRERSVAMSMSVCLSVPCPLARLSKFLTHVTHGRRLFFLRRRLDKLYVLLFVNGTRDESRAFISLIVTHQGQHLTGGVV